MLNFISKASFLLLAVYVFAVNAGIYRGVDSEGHVFYTDQPTENATKFTPTAISVVDSSKAKLKNDDAKKEPAEFKYTKFDIVDPLPNQIIRNQPNISISLRIAPPLNIEQGHNVWLLMDGKALVKNSQSMSLQIGRVERGAHSFQAQVKDGDGKVVVRTRATIAHIKYGGGS